MNNTRSLTITNALLVVLVLFHLTEISAAVQNGVQTMLSSAQTVTQTVAGTTSDLEDEVWWTTTDCPAGVQVPCLDPTADPNLVPADVAAQVEQLVEADWRCLEVAGYTRPDGDDTVFVDQVDRDQCRTYAYLVTSGQAGCWVEHKTAAEGGDELLQGELRLMPAGSTVVGCA